jgi:hypothetical protein
MSHTRDLLPALALALLTGCANVQYNDGDKVVIEHDAVVDEKIVVERATRSCGQFGKTKAVKVAQANKGVGPLDFKKPGMGAQLSTYRCEP